jgi:uncharacterized membrane protein
MKVSLPPRLKIQRWGIPLVYAFLTLTVAMIFPRLEHHFLPDLASSMSVSAAMTIGSAVASGMIALTGIVFSLVFVMVQFSATAYSPRLVVWVSRDPVMSHALGVFISTFLYSLALIAWADRSGSGKVPLISGWLTFALLLASMGMFVALVERIGSLQVNRMLIFTGNKGRWAIEKLYSDPLALASGPRPSNLEEQPVVQTLTYTGQPQVIQTIDYEVLLRLAVAGEAVIQMDVAVGNTLIDSCPLLRVRSPRSALDEAALLSAIRTGDERTFEQDPKYALRIVVDIAIKALSPAINDPTTAVQALDQIEDLLLRLGRSKLDIGSIRDAQGKVRVIAPFPTWEDFLRLAFDEIRYCGASSVQVMRRMHALIKSLCAALPPERHAALRHWEERLGGTVERTFKDAEEQRDASVADRQGLGIGEETVVNMNPK